MDPPGEGKCGRNIPQGDTLSQQAAARAAVADSPVHVQLLHCCLYLRPPSSFFQRC